MKCKRAIFEAAVEVGRSGPPPVPEVMIPLAATAREVEILKEIIDRVTAK